MGTRIKPIKDRSRSTLCFESFGVRILIEASHPDAVGPCRQAVDMALPGYYRFVRRSKADLTFRYNWNRNGRDSLYADGKPVEVGMRRELLLEVLVAQIRLAIGEFAVGYVFIHAGVVVWNGKAVVIPGRSGHGKTSLVVELLKRGATYYSDEFAIIGLDGLVYPFPKTISIRRPHDGRQIEHDAKSIAKEVGDGPAKVDLIVLTRFRPNAKWKPRKLTSARGVLEMIKMTLPIRREPAFVLSILGNAVQNAEIVKSNRSEAAKVADYVINRMT